jgi:enolase-phosphatase E1
MSRDVKIAYLKSLQGYLWQAGYASGALKAPLFPDVAPQIAAWIERDGAKVMIYSSGSVAAQKLLFKHTNGEEPLADLTGVISDYFDTVNAGPKTEPASYEKIAGKYPEVPVGEWLFLSDNVREVEAARAAGMQSCVVERPGNAEVSAEERGRNRVVRSFAEL